MTRLVLSGLLLVITACGRTTPELPEARILSAELARDIAPVPAPDGSQVAFWRPAAEGFGLWVADAELGNARSTGIATAFTEQPIVWSSDGAHLAVMGDGENTVDLVMVSVSDGAVTPLVQTPQFKAPIQFHPDGDRVVFVALTAGGSLNTFTVSRSTREVRPLVAGLETPHLGFASPDGATVLYAAFEQGATTLWLADADGGNRRQLTTEGYEELGNIALSPFSPDGRQVVYTSRRTGKRDVWVADVANGTTHQLTTEIQDDFEPSWSPDGRSVAFLSNRGRQTDVWIMPAAGGEAQRVTDSLEKEAWVRWVGDNILSFSVQHSPGAFWARSLGDGTETRLTPDSLDVGFFVMSNDRSRLAFLLDLAGELNDLAVMPATGGELRMVARGAHHSNLRWSPDDTRLAYTSDQGGSQDAWVATPDGATGLRQLTDWVGSEQVLGWSADGSAIYIYAERESQLGDLWRIPVEGGEPVRVTRDGTIPFAAIATPATTSEIILAMRLDAGVQSVARVREDGSLAPFTTAADGNVVGLQLSPGGDLVALVSPGAGAMTMRLVRVADRQTIATVPNGGPQSFSLDGIRLLYQLPAGESKAPDLGILDIATGTTTRVTATPETESHAAFAADGNSIILRRVRITERVMRVDVSGVLRAAAP